MSEIKRWNVVELVDQFNHARRTADFYTTQPPSHVVSAADFDRVVQERDDWRGRWAAHERLIGRLVADAAELASERDTLARRVAWQPIETAPKEHDGLLLSDGVKVSQGGWLSQVAQGAEYEGQSCAPAAGWWSVDGDFEPTLWMRMPAPPVRD